MKKTIPIVLLTILFFVSCTVEQQEQEEMFPFITLDEYSPITLSDISYPSFEYSLSAEWIRDIFPNDEINDAQAIFLPTLLGLRHFVDDMEDFEDSYQDRNFFDIDYNATEIRNREYQNITDVESVRYNYENSFLTQIDEATDLLLNYYQDLDYERLKDDDEYKNYDLTGTTAHFSLIPQDVESIQGNYYYSLYKEYLDDFETDELYSASLNESFGVSILREDDDNTGKYQVIQLLAHLSTKKVDNPEGLPSEIRNFFSDLMSMYHEDMSLFVDYLDEFNIETEDDWNTFAALVWGEGETEVFTITLTLADRGNIIKSYTVYDFEALQFLLYNPVIV